MPASNPALRQKIARAGAAATNGSPDADRLRAELAEDRIAAHIEKVLAKAPPLTAEALNRLAALLRPIGGEVG